MLQNIIWQTTEWGKACLDPGFLLPKSSTCFAQYLVKSLKKLYPDRTIYSHSHSQSHGLSSHSHSRGLSKRLRKIPNLPSRLKTKWTSPSLGGFLPP